VERFSTSRVSVQLTTARPSIISSRVVALGRHQVQRCSPISGVLRLTDPIVDGGCSDAYKNAQQTQDCGDDGRRSEDTLALGYPRSKSAACGLLSLSKASTTYLDSSRRLGCRASSRPMLLPCWSTASAGAKSIRPSSRTIK
jgi:hypothetical protein